MAWSSLKLGVFYNTSVYQAFLLPILSFVMQLEDVPGNLEEAFSKVLRLMAPGPGNWATPADLVHLKSSYFFPCSLRGSPLGSTSLQGEGYPISRCRLPCEGKGIGGLASEQL